MIIKKELNIDPPPYTSLEPSSGAYDKFKTLLNIVDVFSCLNTVELKDSKEENFNDILKSICHLLRSYDLPLTAEEEIDEIINLSNLIADSNGIKSVHTDVIMVDAFTPQYSKQQYEKMKKQYGTVDALATITEKLLTLRGTSNSTTGISVKNFSKSFIDKMIEYYDLNDVEARFIFSLCKYSTITTLIHENRHQWQFGVMEKYFYDKTPNEIDTIFAIVSVMRACLLKLQDKPESRVLYKFNFMELDARLAQSKFDRKLLLLNNVFSANEQRVFDMSNVDRMYYTVKHLYNNTLENYMLQYINYIKSDFTKTFGDFPYAQKLLNDLNKCNIEKICVDYANKYDLSNFRSLITNKQLTI